MLCDSYICFCHIIIETICKALYANICGCTDLHEYPDTYTIHIILSYIVTCIENVRASESQSSVEFIPIE